MPTGWMALWRTAGHPIAEMHQIHRSSARNKVFDLLAAFIAYVLVPILNFASIGLTEIYDMRTSPNFKSSVIQNLTGYEVRTL